MQCQSYLPMYHSHYDLNVDANGGATPMYNGNGTFRGGHYTDYVSPPPVPRGPFAYKELMRQTMLMHENTFRDQVQELHRLYRRQKELMGEIKSNELYMNHLHLEIQSSNSSTEKISARCGQNTLPTLPFITSYCTPSSANRDNNPISLSYVKEPKPPVSPLASRNDGTTNNLDFGESKGKKIRGKLLDLELPGEVYIDSDDEKSLEDAEFSRAPTLATPPLSNKRSKVEAKSIAMASTACRSLDSVLQGELPSTCSFSRTNTNLADLNEPLAMSYLEESDGDKRINSSLDATSDGAADKPTIKSLAQSDMAKSELGFASSGRKPSYNLGQNPLVVQALPSFNSQLSSSKGAKTCGRQKGPISNKVDASPWCNSVTKSLKNSCSESKFKESVVCMSPKTPDLNNIDLNSAIVANSEFALSGDASSFKRKRCRMIDINLPCDLMTDEEPLIQDDYENSGRLNLNFCANDDGLSPKSSSLDKSRLNIDLEAPISPEVEERSPPRGDSEETQEEGVNHLGELAQVAAEAIVSISSFKSPYTESMDLQIFEASDCENLEWFAGLIHSLSVDLENDSETMNCKDTCGVDDFEAMTLELTEMKAEDYLCKNDVQISSETCLMLLPCQTRKGRTRRSKRKDFQREVLPSLASLSRYEVTEDIQMIEGLMEAAGTPWQLSRTRRACRMGRKTRVVKQPTFIDEVPVQPEPKAFVSWNNINRRPRGRRSPANPTVLSKLLEYSS